MWKQDLTTRKHVDIKDEKLFSAISVQLGLPKVDKTI